MLARPKAYKTVYSCTVLVEEKAPTAKKKSCELATRRGSGGRWRSCHPEITLNTGFGGEAGPMASHHPAG
jgi:hypothetical protein